jgi:hypothetical protein
MAKGKWDSRKGQFPRRAAGDEAFIEKVSLAKATYACYPIAGLADKWVELKKEKEQHEADVSLLNVELEAIAQVLLDQMEAQDLTHVETNTGQKLGVKTDIYPTVVDKQLLEAHIAANPDLEYLYNVHPASLASFVRDLLERGLDAQLPPGISIFFKSTVGVRKS